MQYLYHFSQQIPHKIQFFNVLALYQRWLLVTLQSNSPTFQSRSIYVCLQTTCSITHTDTNMSFIIAKLTHPC